MRSVKAIRLGCLVVIGATLSCAGTTQTSGTAPKQHELSSQSHTGTNTGRVYGPSVEILPSPDNVNGYSAADQRELFVGEELYELIDGGAVQFFKHGFEWAVAAGYQREGGDRVTVQLYRMKTPVAASSVFTERSPAEAIPALVGERSGILGNSFDFCRGSYYVTLVSFEEGEPGNQSTLELARAIDGHLLGGM